MTGSPKFRSKGNDAFSDWRGLPSVMRGWARTRSCPYSMKDIDRGGSLNSLASVDRAARRNSNDGKPHIRIPAPDGNAIVQKGLLPLRAINRRSPIRVFAGANLIGERGELAVPGYIEIVDRKLCGLLHRGARCNAFPSAVAHDHSVNLRGRRKSSAKKVRQRRLAKPKAAAADRGRDEIALIDRSVKMFAQRSFLGGKHARDKAGGVFPHDAAVGDPIDDQNRTDRKQDENTDAQTSVGINLKVRLFGSK